MFIPNQVLPERVSSVRIIDIGGDGLYEVVFRGENTEPFQMPGSELAEIMEFYMPVTTSFGANIALSYNVFIDSDGNGVSLETGGAVNGTYVFPLNYSGDIFFVVAKQSVSIVGQVDVVITRDNPNSDIETRHERISAIGVLPSESFRSEGAPSNGEVLIKTLGQIDVSEGAVDISINKLTGKIFIRVCVGTDMEREVHVELVSDIIGTLDRM